MKPKQLFGIVMIGLIIFSMVYVGCKNDPKPKVNNPTKTPDKPKVIVPEFSSDSAFQFVKKQIDFGPRVPNSTAHVACGDWFTNMFKQYGAEVIEQRFTVKAFDGTVLNSRNIIASFSPEKKSRILLCAHWDTRPFGDKDADKAKWSKAIDGANDGASGVGVALEIARQMHNTASNVGVDIILFDSEDYGTPEFADESKKDVLNDQFITSWCLGSQYYGLNKHVNGYNPRFGILLDMVGAGDAQFNKEKYSNENAGDVINLVWSAASKLGYEAYFTDNEVEGVIDDHVMLGRSGIRCIDIIDTRPQTMAMGLGGYVFGSYHHTHKDNLSIIDKNTLKAVGQTLLQVIYNQ
jgi:glutaminyl-peptide cyclotransferase